MKLRIKFRSRLEARWAVFLDALGVRWEYEPEGYDLGDGLYYLPDFRLHGVTINHAYLERNATIDGDYFAAYPGVDKRGTFTL